MNFHVGSPAVRGSLTGFPVVNGEAVASRGYDLDASSITVAERAGEPVAAGMPEVETPGRRARRFVLRVAATPLDAEGRGRSPYARVTGLRWRGRAVPTVAVNVRHQLVAA